MNEDEIDLDDEFGFDDSATVVLSDVQRRGLLREIRRNIKQLNDTDLETVAFMIAGYVNPTEGMYGIHNDR